MGTKVLWLVNLRRFQLMAAVSVLATLGCAAWATGSARAATTWTVDTTADDVAGNAALCTNGHCPTLRDAVAKASSDSGDTIVLTAASQPYQVTNGELQPASDMQIQGAGAASTTIDAGGSNRVFEIPNGVTATISGVSITGGDSGGVNSGAGGAIYVAGALNLDNSVITGNTANTSGGGIDANGTLNIDHSTISNNKTTGGLGIGGGIDCFCTQVTVTNSTISGNMASGGEGNNGGGIQYSSGSPLVLTASTVSGNTAGADGGGIYLGGGGGDLTNDTIASNMAGTEGGGVDQETDGLNLMNVTLAQNNSPGGANYFNGDFSGSVQNTIFAGPLAAGQNDCSAPFTGSNLTSNGGNLEDETPASDAFACWLSGTTQPSDQASSNANPNLGPLADNGGPTETMALQAGSTAIDKAVSSGAPSTDQRGGPRPQPPGGADDIGAYEVGAVVDTAISKSASPGPATAGQTLTYTLTATNSGPSSDPAYAVTVSDKLPSGVTFQSASASQGSCSNASGTVTCQLGTVNKGASPTVTIKVTPAAAGALTNTGTVASSALDPNTANNSSTVTTQVQAAAVQAANGTKPVALTEDVTRVTFTSATLHGAVDPGGASTTYFFEYGTKVTDPNTPSKSAGSGTKLLPVSQGLTGLRPGTLYHYRLVASNANGTTRGVDRTFRTPRRPSIHVAPARVLAGARVRVFGNAGGCRVGDRVTLMSQAFTHTHEFAGVPAVYARVGRGGAYSTFARVPAGRGPGHYLVTGRCGGGNLGVSVFLTVFRPVVPKFTG